MEYVFAIPRFTKKNTMADTKAFLDKLGNPDRALHTIHVAGTNGKGSVCAYIRSILEAAGKKVAVFTSPHLVDVRERFVIEGQMVSREAFLHAFLQVYDMLDWEELAQGRGYHPTFFEYLFFMAMLLFKDAMPDYCILETGLGGRLDATNSVSKKELAVITRISLEHVEYLGDTIEKIAGEKAGIIAQDTPVVFLDAEKEASQVFWEKAKLLSAPCYPVSKSDYSLLEFHNKSIDFSYVSRYDYNINARLHTIAQYQAENCALAMRAVEILDTEHGVDVSAFKKGAESCFWAGRMEEVLPEVYVDGAHNEDGVRAFVETVKKDGHDGRRKLLFSVVSDKDYVSMLHKLTEEDLFSHIALAHLESSRAASLEEMRKQLPESLTERITVFEHVKDAFESILAGKQKEERVYIVGSLYLVGEIKEYLSND